MNQLAKNLFLTLCVVAALLVILGLKRKFSGDGNAALLSQPSADIKAASPGSTKSSPRPRVLQAKPITQHDRAILSPTNSRYADSAAESSPAGGASIAQLPLPIHSPRPIDVPELVAVDQPLPSPATANIGDSLPDSTPEIETPSLPVAVQTLPEFVLTDSEDSFWSISERVYGSGEYYRALFRHNETKVLRPDQLRAGVEVRTPSLEVLRELYPADFPDDPSSTR